jgi:5-methyltetrahydrofolate--homocysteine methyltransferase
LLEVAQKSIDLDYDGLMIESHVDPDNAWSDAKQQIIPEQVELLLNSIIWRKEDIDNKDLSTAIEFLRQQIKKAAGQPNISLADFIKKEGTGIDYIGAFSVTIEGIEPHIKRLENQLDDYNKIILQALADRLAEAFAELLHKKTRLDYWGYATDEHLTNEQLIKEEYLGIRPAPGYPACPDHTEKYKLFELLGGEKATGIHLTESLAMYPASSVCGWYFANPASKYFGVGKINEDQLKDYAQRKGMQLDEAKKWLSPILD